jgi:hypothetical protein
VLKAKLRSSAQLSNLLNCVHLEVVVPKTIVSDLGKSTKEFVAAAGISYQRQFPNRPFTNYRKDELECQVTIVPGSRYERLIGSIEKSSLVGIYFPNPIQGFSVHAQREQMSNLPEGFILSGPLDTAIGWVMYPDILGRDNKTPAYDCSAVQWRSAGRSLYFEAGFGDATFGAGAGLRDAGSRCSGGLLFVG